MMRTWSTMLRRRPRSQEKTKDQNRVREADGVALDVWRRRAQVEGYIRLCAPPTALGKRPMTPCTSETTYRGVG